MPSSSKLTFARSALVACLSLATPFALWGQSVVRSGADRISIDADGLSLEKFFDELSAIVPVEFLLLAPETRQVSASLKLSNVHPVLGVHKFLEEAEVDYAVSGGDGDPFRILVGPFGDARLSASLERGPEREENTSDDSYIADSGALGETRDSSAASSQQTPPNSNQGRWPITGMARPGSPGGMTGPRFATGMASPEGALAPEAPGGVVPPPLVGEPGNVMTPSPPENVVTPSPPGNVMTPPPAGQAAPRSRKAPSIPSRVTGGAFVATGSAGLSRNPVNRQVAATGGLLAFGLSLGVLLVRKPHE